MAGSAVGKISAPAMSGVTRYDFFTVNLQSQDKSPLLKAAKSLTEVVRARALWVTSSQLSTGLVAPLAQLSDKVHYVIMQKTTPRGAPGTISSHCPHTQRAYCTVGDNTSSPSRTLTIPLELTAPFLSFQAATLGSTSTSGGATPPRLDARRLQQSDETSAS